MRHRGGAATLRVALLGAILLSIGVGHRPATAQVLLASAPQPEFTVGPLFVIANVTPDLEVTVNVTFSLTPKPGASREAIQQDLVLLWPAEVRGATTPGAADPALARDVERRGFQVAGSGRLALHRRDRAQLGTGVLGDPLPVFASYVTLLRRDPIGSQLGAVSYIKIPWTPALADPLTVLTLPVPVRGLVIPRAASWLAEMFWGRRFVLTVGYGDVGSPVTPLYALYFEHRDRVVRLAPEFSAVMVSFADADHLLVEDVQPPSATRRPSRVRAGREVVTLVLTPTEAVVPQNVKVQFSYFSGAIAWRPIVISLALLVLGNIAGAFMFGREMFGLMRQRRRARLGAARLRGPLTASNVATLVPGVATYDDVVARWGPPDVERTRISPPGPRTLIYRAEHDGRAHEVEIRLEDGRVSEVEQRVSRLPS